MSHNEPVPCPDCDERIYCDDPWHCSRCDHHYSIALDPDECGNCHAPRPKKETN